MELSSASWLCDLRSELISDWEDIFFGATTTRNKRASSLKQCVMDRPVPADELPALTSPNQNLSLQHLDQPDAADTPPVLTSTAVGKHFWEAALAQEMRINPCLEGVQPSHSQAEIPSQLSVVQSEATPGLMRCCVGNQPSPVMLQAFTPACLTRCKRTARQAMLPASCRPCKLPSPASSPLDDASSVFELTCIVHPASASTPQSSGARLHTAQTASSSGEQGFQLWQQAAHSIMAVQQRAMQNPFAQLPSALQDSTACDGLLTAIYTNLGLAPGSVPLSAGPYDHGQQRAWALGPAEPASPHKGLDPGSPDSVLARRGDEACSSEES